MSYEVMFQNAVSLHEAGQFDEAERLYRQILETAPNHPDVLNLLGLVAQAKGAQAEACSLFMQAIKHKPNEPSFYYNLAFSCKVANKPVEALEYFKNVALLAPQIKETYNEIALLLMQLGNVQDARKNWQYAIDLDNKYVEALAHMAWSYRGENSGKAIVDLEALVSDFSSDAIVFYYLVQLYMERGWLDKAWNAAIKAKDLAPTSDEIRVLLGRLSILDNKPENAKIYFAKAELINPNNIDALLGLANLYSKNNDFCEAELRYKRVIELEPNNYDAHNNYAEMLQRCNRLAEALEEYRKAILINPKSAESSNNLAMILRDTGDFDEALGLLFNALVYKPEMEEISINITETLIMLSKNDSDKAIKIAENWFKNHSDNIFAKHINSVFKGECIENNKIYTEKLFDNFADSYELVMQNLDYSVPLAMARITGSLQGRIVDLGCGTGLVGQTLKNNRNQIIGVDISQKMLDVASEKGVYDELIKADIEEYLTNNSDFDWAIAADVFNYFGELSQIIKLLKNKKLAFTIEVLDKDADYKIQNTGRYKHNPIYVENLLRENGFDDIIKEEIILRTEDGVSVKGLIFKGE